MTRVGVLALSLLVMAAIVVGSPATTLAQGSAASPEQQLVDKFAPIAYLRQQKAPCDNKGEPYFPVSVDSVLGNPAVALKRHTTKSASTDPVIMMGPTAQDLAGEDESYYLDFPGNPLHPGCTYEQDFKALVAKLHLKPTVYAHLVVDHEHEKLVIQYWFWWYFNDFNDKHEGDWEMVQVVFNATTAQQALTQEPAQLAYAQHSGGELSTWDDSKLQIQDGHPVTYPAAGSHADYYGSNLYIGWGASTGFGCDNTSPPTNRVPLQVILTPDDPSPTGPFAWLTYDGSWGERAKAVWDGPTGPNTNFSWRQPILATENWRSYSLTVPASHSIGPSATNLFCNLSASGSLLATRLLNRPLVLASVFLGIIAAIIILLYVERHALGAAWRLYRQYWRTFVGIGLLTIPIGIAFNLLAILFRDYPPGEWLMQWFNDDKGAHLASVVFVSGAQEVAMLLVVMPPVLQAVRDARSGRTPEIRRSFRRGYAHLWPIVVAMVLFLIALGLLATIPLFGWAVALWLGVSWQFFGQVIVLDGQDSGWRALGTSFWTVRRHWWRALLYSLLFQIFIVLPGPFLGALLMLLGKLSVDWANAFSSIVYALTVPIAVIGLAQVYQRLQQRQKMASQPVAEPTAGSEAAPA